MCAKFGCGPTVVSKKRGGTDKQTDRQRETAALYSRRRQYSRSNSRNNYDNIQGAVAELLPLCLSLCLRVLAITAPHSNAKSQVQ